MNKTLLRDGFAKLCGILIDAKWDLKYRGSVDGFGLKAFHKKSVGVKKCLTIVEDCGGNIFGGYISGSWNGDNLVMNDPEAYIFSLINRRDEPLKIKCSKPCHAAHSPDEYYLQVYGIEDLKIFENGTFAHHTSSFNPGSCYSDETFVQFFCKEPTNLLREVSNLAAKTFMVNRIEMYSLLE